MIPAAVPFELAIAVEPADIDQLGHVNNVVYLRWVQEAAVAHWTAIAPATDQAKLLWVVVRHEIDYKQAAFLGDRIIARTWVGAPAGFGSNALPNCSGPGTAASWPRHAPGGVP